MIAGSAVALLLVANCACYYGSGAEYWASPVLLISLVAGFVLLNTFLLPARFLSLANIFLLLLALLHLGYYIPR
jgi:hypothetical protein